MIGALAVGTLGEVGAVRVGRPAVGRRLTARSLLESEEFANVASDNLLMLGDAVADAAELHARVSAALRNVSDTIRARDPASHQQMDDLELSAEQVDRALGVLRKFGDRRVADLAQDVVAAMRESQEVGGDAEDVQRGLAKRWAPRYESLLQLSEELEAGTPEAYALKLGGRHHAEAVATGRRLSEADMIGVRAQAHTLLHTLELQLGESMPKAPSRMLLEDSSTTGEDAGFMSCVTKAVSTMSPTKVVSCVIENMSEFMSMAKNFVPGFGK